MPSGDATATAARTCSLSPADLEEVVEVLAEDRQEPDPLEQRQAGVLRHGEHPFVEIEPGKLPV